MKKSSKVLTVCLTAAILVSPVATSAWNVISPSEATVAHANAPLGHLKNGLKKEYSTHVKQNTANLKVINANISKIKSYTKKAKTTSQKQKANKLKPILTEMEGKKSEYNHFAKHNKGVYDEGMKQKDAKRVKEAVDIIEARNKVMSDDVSKLNSKSNDIANIIK